MFPKALLSDFKVGLQYSPNSRKICVLPAVSEKQRKQTQRYTHYAPYRAYSTAPQGYPKSGRG